MCPFHEANELASNANNFFPSLLYLLQCIIQYDCRTPCNPLAAPPQAQEVSLHLDRDASQGVSPYLVRNADGACLPFSLSTFLAQALARLKLRCDRKVRVPVVRDWCGV